MKQYWIKYILNLTNAENHVIQTDRDKHIIP